MSHGCKDIRFCSWSEDGMMIQMQKNTSMDYTEV